MNACRGDIYNLHGHLTCIIGTADAPQGSYRETCWNLVVNNNNLTAQCFTRNYQASSTYLAAFDTCRSQIYNFTGNLSCNRGTADLHRARTSRAV